MRTFRGFSGSSLNLPLNLLSRVILDKHWSELKIVSMTLDISSDLKDRILFMVILDKCSGRDQGQPLAGGLLQIRNYDIERQLFARRPQGKICARGAALENVTGVEG